MFTPKELNGIKNVCLNLDKLLKKATEGEIDLITIKTLASTRHVYAREKATFIKNKAVNAMVEINKQKSNIPVNFDPNKD